MEKQITVLIADDNTFFRESLRILLSTSEFIIAGEAKNGEEAIVLAASLKPVVILMDIDMSPVNGFEATRKILKENPEIRIIGLSMHREKSYCRNLMNIGARGFISKSTSPSDIIQAIVEVAAGRKYISKDISS